MIIHADYDGPPFAPTPALGCGDCRRATDASLAGLSYSTVGALVLGAFVLASIGIASWGFSKRPRALAGRRKR